MENSNDENLNSGGGFSESQKSGFESDNIENNTQVQENTPIPRPSSLPQSGEMSSVGILFQKAFEVYKFNFWKFIGLTLVPVLCGFVLFVFFGIFTFFGFLSMKAVGEIVMIIVLVIFLILVLVLVFVSVIAQTSMLILIRDSEKNLSIKELLVEGRKYAANYFVIQFLVGLLVLLWMFLFIVPGIIMGVYYSLASWVLIYEGLTGFKAIKRSKELIKGYWWAFFGRVLAVWGAYYLIMIIPSFLKSGMLSLLISLLSFAVVPFFLVYTCFLYWDLIRIKGN